MKVPLHIIQERNSGYPPQQKCRFHTEELKAGNHSLSYKLVAALRQADTIS